MFKVQQKTLQQICKKCFSLAQFTLNKSNHSIFSCVWHVVETVEVQKLRRVPLAIALVVVVLIFFLAPQKIYQTRKLQRVVLCTWVKNNRFNNSGLSDDSKVAIIIIIVLAALLTESMKMEWTSLFLLCQGLFNFILYLPNWAHCHLHRRPIHQFKYLFINFAANFSWKYWIFLSSIKVALRWFSCWMRQF